MELNWKTMKKILGIITFTVVLCAMLIRFDQVLSALGFLWGVCFPFILGGAIAFVLNLPMRFFERHIKGNGKIWKKLARPVSLVLTLLFAAGLIAVLLGVVVPQLAGTVDSIVTAMTDFWPRAQQWLIETFGDWEGIMSIVESWELDWGQLFDSVKNIAFNGAGNVLTYTMSATMQVVNGVVTFFIAFIFSFYLLLQKENLSRQLTRLLKAVCKEKTVDRVLRVCSLAHGTFSKFIAGQCLEAMILGGMFFVVMTIFKFPYALLVGVLIAFTALIPIVGAFVGCFVGAFLILMVNPMQALAFVILFLVLQQVEGNLIYPQVVGNSVGLPSMWVLFAVTVGGSLMGVAGMLLFIPIMSVVYSLLRDWVRTRVDGGRKQSDPETRENHETTETTKTAKTTKTEE